MRHWWMHADLRLSAQALQRAAQRAWELAARTGTSIVVSHEGKIAYIRPQLEASGLLIQEPSPPYGDKT